MPQNEEVRILLLVVTLSLSLVSCSGDRQVTDGCARDRFTDLDREPNYTADYLVRWETAGGCPVRLDVVMTRVGGCFKAIDEIVMAWPALSVMTVSNTRIFVKDPKNVARDRVTARAFDADASLSSGAQETGLRQMGAELWVEEDGEALYLVYDDHIERWPHDPEPIGCM
jgi:hypothetical protein